MNAMAGAGRGVTSYMPPSARSNGVRIVDSASASRDFTTSVEKAVVLRGEDFPSLQAARPVSSGTSQKQKDSSNQKQKQVVGEESTQDKKDSYHLGPVAEVHPVGQSARNTGGNRLVNNVGEGHGMGSGQRADQIRKREEYFPDPLPLVHMNPRSDWADDERDTGHGFVDQGRDVGFSNSENYWDRDFDLPRPGVLPHKAPSNQYERWGQRDNETGKNYSSEVPKMDPYNKDVRAPSQEGKEVNRWRASLPSNDGFISQEVGNYRGDVGARMAGHRNIVKENKYTPLYYGDTGRDGSTMHNRDSAFGRRDLALVGHQQQERNKPMESFTNRGAERNSRDCYVTEQPNRYRGDNFQKNTLSRSSFSSSGKMPPITDPILTMGRDRRFSKSDRPFSDDPFLRDFSSTGFDERDLFSGGLVGVIKRKKDAAKSTDFHDPVRESFEAELERVQKMQELERQRIIEEQERALEQARREEEERQRRIREEEELRRRLEEEAREAAWRAEQERLEAIRRGEEQRIAREEEKRRIELEEERRKQAAKQKLEELEARMAKRQAEATNGSGSVSKTIVDEKLEAAVKEKHISRNLDLDTWEDGERMVENVMASGSFDSSSHDRPVEMSSRPYPAREGSSNFIDKGKAVNSWKKDVFESGGSFTTPLSDQETAHYSPRRDAFGSARAASRKEFHGGSGYMPSRAYVKGGVQEPYSDDFGYQKDHRWNLSGNADPYGKLSEMDSEFHDSIADKYGDSGWGQGRVRGNSRPYPERFYPHSEVSELYPYGRSRYSLRQPRVLPPPSLGPTQRTSFGGVTERHGPSTFQDNGINYTHGIRTEPNGQTAYYGNNQESLEPSDVFGLPQENTTSQDQKLNNTPRCDSQSSLSVSSPPTSPPQLSHDELDESGDSPVTSAVAEGKRNLLAGSGSVVHNANSGNGITSVVSDSVSAVEDEEWTLENDDSMQQQEEYDEDEDGYREEDEVREGDDENLELHQKFEVLELEERESPHMMDNVVLGFDEGVEVVIPSDDFEKNLGTQERSFGIPESSVGIMEERGGPLDGFPSDEQSLLPADAHGTSADSSSCEVQEKSALQGSTGQHVGAPYPSAAAGRLDSADSSGNAALTAKQTGSASSEVVAATSQTDNMPSSSSGGNQGDLPVKLQFGLFSGPSLIPSPVPAIQIGSIQMPLHIHPPVGPSITHMHQSQPPMFQFGQLRYTPPVSQGIVPMAPPSMSFVQPSLLGHFNLNQNAGGSGNEPAGEASAQNVTKDNSPSLSTMKQPSLVSASPEQSSDSLSQGLNTVLNADRHEDNSVVRASSSGIDGPSDEKMKSEYISQSEEKGQQHSASKSNIPSSKERGSGSQLRHVQSTMKSVAGDKNFSGLRGLGPLSGGKGKRFAYAVKNSNTRSSVQDHDMLTDSNGFQGRPRRTVQRTEFRIRENGDRRPTPVVVASNDSGLDDKSNYNGKAVGVFTRSGSKRGTFSNRYMKQRSESEPLASGNIRSQEVSPADRIAKDLSNKSQNISHSGDTNLRSNVSEEDVDAPLQSGVVRVFKQPGIEAPSDEDDFIEVRSKRQMLNDRREQREKEIKAKSHTTKPPRRTRTSRQKDVISRSHNKVSVKLGSQEASKMQLDFTSSKSPQFANNEITTEFSTAVSQPPIGTSAVNSEAQAINRPSQAGTSSLVSSGGTECDPGLLFDSKNKVMSLSQTQIDDAMKPAHYDSHITAVGGHSSTVSDPILPTSSILTKDKTFSSGASPINSLLAGEKIQFGAVTSPTILHPSSRVLSHGIGAPGSNRDVQISRGFPVSEKDSSLFFEKEKHLNDSCVPLQDCEAEAEAAASAVAVAAISSDEIVGNGLGSVNDTKTFSGADIDGITTGVVGDQHLASPSRGEELLSVSLPADLSVETTPISLWPPLPSPQSSSTQMLSHFPAGPPSHFPFYEMNPLLGGPIFAFSPHEESSGSQSQPQKSTPPSSGPLGNWQQSHSGVDSFYGPPAGYSGPFIGPHGGIPGVQGPPHMVVYNHFAPVGQYRQRSAPNMTAPIQHLAPGSPLLPMPSPMPLFDVSPFQTAPDLPVQARWGHIPASPLHTAAVSRPSQQQVESALPSQVNHRYPIDQSLNANRLTESRTPTPSDSGPSFTAADTNVTPFSTELGLADSLRSNATSSGQSVAVQNLSGTANAESAKTDNIENSKRQNASSVKAQFSKKNTSNQQGNTSGYNSQRGGMSQRNNTGNDWSYRRMGFHGRNHSSGVDKGFPSSKVKQIYVAKQSTSGNSTT
ncbi:Actin filament-coating protein tropomyosin [Handroanthus impetiginosus]|uniref:Actin filament-coating protein tropomyosin n=1 Tax=Handroanthus impetiginosus TaxID=429701 RepID=A0A2G9GXT7_9LAMI|nr:Actin filament-coating protein tropomyosin [Handroanthus impetiginosus]